MVSVKGLNLFIIKYRGVLDDSYCKSVKANKRFEFLNKNVFKYAWKFIFYGSFL